MANAEANRAKGSIIWHKDRITMRLQASNVRPAAVLSSKRQKECYHKGGLTKSSVCGTLSVGLLKGLSLPNSFRPDGGGCDHMVLQRYWYRRRNIFRLAVGTQN